jgi:hypothetical protein
MATRHEEQLEMEENRAEKKSMKAAMVDAMKHTYGDVAASCAMTGIPRSTHYRWLHDDGEYAKAMLDGFPRGKLICALLEQKRRIAELESGLLSERVQSAQGLTNTEKPKEVWEMDTREFMAHLREDLVIRDGDRRSQERMEARDLEQAGEMAATIRDASSNAA